MESIQNTFIQNSILNTFFLVFRSEYFLKKSKFIQYLNTFYLKSIQNTSTDTVVYALRRPASKAVLTIREL